MAIRVLHLGTEYTWRGGENQVRLLIDGLNGKVAAQFGATPTKSMAFTEKRWNCNLLGLSSGNPYDPINLFRLVRYIRKNQINIIDAHTAKAHTLALNISAFLPQLKIVVHRRVDNVPKKNYFTKRKYFHPRISQFTAISKYIEQVLINYGIKPEKISVARSAVSGEAYAKLDRDECRTKWLEKFRLPKNQILIGNASALSVQKGHQTLLKAASELQKTVINFTVLIAGDGKLKGELEQLTRDLKLTEKVKFVGFIQNVPEFLSALDILAVPSNNEGLGTVILDGILAGCALVGSNVGGIPEIIIHNETGLLEEVGDYKMLAQNLADLIENPGKTQNLKMNAQNRVLKEFGLQSMVQENLKIYQGILGK
jgi:L-malate glycosyltransferase